MFLCVRLEKLSDDVYQLYSRLEVSGFHVCGKLVDTALMLVLFKLAIIWTALIGPFAVFCGAFLNAGDIQSKTIDANGLAIV